MIAGGLGNIRRSDVEKREVAVGAPLVVLGGPAMLIGLGGGAASSVGSGQSSSDLDFASVQRGNAEMQRRAQEVIDRCWAQGDANPILLIHDVGAGGLVECAARGDRAQPPRRAHRSAQDSERRAGALADGDLVQRGAGALRARARSGKRRAVRGLVRARALSLRRGRRDHRAMGDCASIDPLCPTHAGRHADRGAARQAAAHDAQRAQRRRSRAPRCRPTASASPNRSSACCVCRPSPTSPF